MTVLFFRFHTFLLLISFSCLLMLARTSTTMLISLGIAGILFYSQPTKNDSGFVKHDVCYRFLNSLCNVKEIPLHFFFLFVF